MPPGDKAQPAPSLRWLRRATQGIRSSNVTHGAPPGGSAPRLGVLSGTFNPPTRAHVALAEAAVARLALDEVLCVLPEAPPHKAELEASLEERAQMLWVAVQEHAHFSAALVSHGLFLDIHRAVVAHYPAGTQVYFLVGKDAAERILVNWPYEDPLRALEEMFANFSFAVAGRGGAFRLPAGSPAQKFAAQIFALELEPEFQEISATRARDRAARDEPLRGMVPDAVAELIENRGIYSGKQKKIYRN
jgi:nicotinate (nicotinamide) nucleotide adenylyltransferase